MGANDLVWTADINADPFVQSTNRMRAEAKRTRDDVQRFVDSLRESNVSPLGRLYDKNSMLLQARERGLLTESEFTLHHEQNRIAIDKLRNAEQQRTAAMVAGVPHVNRYGMAIQQLAYGVEDAASQFGTMGLAGAIRGASNNLSAAAMSFGPTAAIAASLGATVAMVGSQFLETGKQARAFSEDVKEIETRYRGLNNEIQRARELAENRNKSSLIPTMSAESASDAIRQSRLEMEKNEAEIKKRSETIPGIVRAMTSSLLKEAEHRKAHPGIEAGFMDFERLDKEISEYKRILKLGGDQIVSEGRGLFDRITQDTGNVGLSGKLLGPDGKIVGSEDLKQAREQFNQIEELRKENLRRQEENQKLGVRSQQAHASELKDALKDALGGSGGGGGAVFQDSRKTAEDIRIAERYWNETRTPAEKYGQTLREIERLQKDSLIDETTARRAAQHARDEMNKEFGRGISIPIYFRRPIDARSAEALTPYFDAINKTRFTNPTKSIFPSDNSLNAKPPMMGDQEAKKFLDSIMTSPKNVGDSSEKLAKTIEKLNGLMSKSVSIEERQINSPASQPQLNIANF